MTLSLTYDPVLSRVQIAGITPYDSFTRSVSNGWGSTSTGNFPWTTTGGTASEYSVTGTKGRMAVSGVTNTRNAILGSLTDSDVTVDTIAPVLATGARINVAVLARYQDGNNQYSLNASYKTDGSVDLFILKRVASVETELDRASSLLTYTPGTSYHMRFQVVGDTLRGKMWIGSEPAAWAVEGTANDLPTGAVGLRGWITNGNTNTLPVNLDFDDFTLLSWVKVERSTNQVTWTTVRGGSALTPVSSAISLDDYEFSPDVPNYYRAVGQTANITPTLDGVWLKSLARPFLNRKVTVRDFSEISRASRAGVFPIVGRSFPVAVTDLHGSRRWTLDVYAESPAEAEELDLLISTGEVQFVHVPTTGRLSAVPGGYVALGDTSEEVLPTHDLALRVVSLPFTEVAAPGADVIPAVGTWQSVINTYTDWSATIAAHTTWDDLLQLVGSPADVIVP